MHNKNESIRTKIEYALIFLTGGISLFIAIVYLTGLLDSSSWVAQRVPSLTLLAVGFIASYLALERQGKIDVMAVTMEKRGEEILQAISRSSSDTISALSGVEVISFASSAEFVTYASQRFGDSKRIDDVTLSSSKILPISREDIEAYQKYQDAISQIAKKPNAIWREVAIFHSEKHFQREKQRVLEKENIAYNLAYYDVSDAGIPPRIGFAVIDKQEVLVSNSYRTIWLSIKHPDITKYFSAYFDHIWQDAKKIKQANVIDHQELDKLEKTPKNL